MTTQIVVDGGTSERKAMHSVRQYLIIAPMALMHVLERSKACKATHFSHPGTRWLRKSDAARLAGDALIHRVLARC